MNGLAGFDYVLELSQRTLLRLLQDTLTIGGVPLQPPFPLRLPITAGDSTVVVHLIVEDVQLDVDPGNRLRLTLRFVRSSIEFGTFGAAVYPLSGTVQADVAMRLDALGNHRLLAFAFADAVVGLTLSEEARHTLANGAGRMGRTPAAATALIEDALRGAVRGGGTLRVPIGFTVEPEADGDLVRRQFSRLELFGLAHPDRNRQALALFGNLFAATEHQGNPGLRNGSGIGAGSDVLIAISPRAFQTFIFCPAVAAQLGVPPEDLVARLPTSCGRAQGLDHEGVTIKRIEATLDQDLIAVLAAVEKSGFCYEASGVVICHVRVAVNSGILTSTAGIAFQKFGAAIDWYCALVFTGGLAVYGAAVLAWVAGVIEGIAESKAQTAVVGRLAALGLGPELAVPQLPTVFTAMSITPAELVLQSRLRARFVAPPPIPSLDLVATGTQVVSSSSRPGVFTTQIFCKPEPKRYGYVETRQSQRITYDLRAQLLPQPLSVTYSVKGRSGEWVPLAPQPAGLPASPAVVPDVECQYAMPLATGGSKVVKSVSLRYRVTGTSIALTGDVGDGNFWVDLRAEVRDPAGQPPAGVNASPVASVFFRGNLVEMDEEYRADLEECLRIADQVSDRFSKSRHVPAWVKALDPVARLSEQLRALSALDPEQGQEMLRDLRNVNSAVVPRLDVAGQRAKLASTAGDRSLDATDVETRIEAAIAELSASLAELRRRR